MKFDLIKILLAVFVVISFFTGYYSAAKDMSISFEMDNETNEAITLLAFSAREISEHAQMAIFLIEDCTIARNNTEIWCDRNSAEFITGEQNFDVWDKNAPIEAIMGD